MTLLAPEIRMPDWLENLASQWQLSPFDTVEERLRLAILLAAENVRHALGGPFAAVVFDSSGRIAGIGVNQVMRAGQSWAHAEMMAIANAQYRRGAMNLSGCELVSSCEPCVMCFGGTLWSGVSSLVYGAPGRFPAEVGFDEGDKVAQWHDSLERRGVKVTGPLLADEAYLPFQLYRDAGGTLY